MAEQELINHTKKAFKIWGEKKNSFWHKLKDFVIEIFIIVFAISLSIWFHNWSEHKNEQKQVKSFLMGLKDDITADIKSTESILEAYKQYEKIYTYMSHFSIDRIPDKDLLHTALQYIKTSTTLRTHKTRFNGFLSAGKIMTIENDSLSLDILNYYQETLPTLQLSEDAWINQNRLMQSFLLDNVSDFDNDYATWKVLATSKGRYISTFLIPWDQLIERYERVITHGNSIISKIEELYPKEK